MLLLEAWKTKFSNSLFFHWSNWKKRNIFKPGQLSVVNYFWTLNCTYLYRYVHLFLQFGSVNYKIIPPRSLISIFCFVLTISHFFKPLQVHFVPTWVQQKMFFQHEQRPRLSVCHFCHMCNKRILISYFVLKGQHVLQLQHSFFHSDIKTNS